jgi:3-oxoacyl-[acyl-carrier protein] reductase
MRDFEGKVAIVTGASRRIGAAIAVELGRRGAAVVVNYLTRKDLAERVGGQVEAAGGRALVHQADVRDREAIRAMVDRTAEAFGGVDVLINNARSMHPKGSFLEMTWEKHMLPMIEVHLAGAFHCCQAVVPHMLKRGGGAILNLLSISFRRGDPNLHAYSSAKAALRSFTMTLAADLGRQGIRVNSISPGTTETEEFRARYTEEERVRMRQEIPLGHIATPEEVSGAAVFLCSEEARYITGVDVVVSGGRSIPF